MSRLLALDLPALTQQLIAAVRDARRLATEGHDLELHQLLEEVRVAAEGASGPQYELLQLAEAALRTAARTDLGRAELAMRQFLAKVPTEAEEIFATLLIPQTLSSTRVQALSPQAQQQIEDLVRVGVLARGALGYELRPAHRALARDLHEPAVLRMWRIVDHCKSQITTARLDLSASAAYLAAHLGITEPQATRFLARSHVAELQGFRYQFNWTDASHRIAFIGPKPQNESGYHDEIWTIEDAWRAHLDRMTDRTLSAAIGAFWINAQQAVGTLPVPMAIPSEDGSMHLAWDRDEHHLDVDLHGDGTYEWFYSNRITDELDGTDEDRVSGMPADLASRFRIIAPQHL